MSNFKVWQGTFQSSTVPNYVEGFIKILLPSDSEKLSTLPYTKAIITYGGTYRNGMSVGVNFEIKSSEGKLIAYGTPEYSGNTQSFSLSIKEVSEKKIEGDYNTERPYDRGTFKAYKTDINTLPKSSATYDGGCVIA